MDNLVLDKKPYNFDRVFRLLVSLLIIGGLFWLIHELRTVLIPFVVAFLLAYLLNPLVNKTQEHIKNRVCALAITLLAILGIVGILAILIIPTINAQMGEMARVTRNVLVDANIAQRVQEILPVSVWQDVRASLGEANVQQLLHQEDILGMAKPIMERVLPSLMQMFSGAGSLLSAFTTAAVILMYLVFLLLDFDRSKEEWKELIPGQYHDVCFGFLHDFEEAMSRYFRGQAIIAACTGVLFAIGFSIIGMPMGIVLGLGIGALNMVPYLQLIGLIPAVLLAVVHAADAQIGIGSYLLFTGGVFLVVQIIQDAVLTPRIMGKATGLSPALILLSLSVWGALLGFLGLVIALPMTCLLLAMYKRVLQNS